MNFENFRRTGELSDITVLVDDGEFKLHTFPLFTKSNYFKKAVELLSEQQQPDSHHHLTVKLDKFPGGKNVFSQMADFFYNIPITIDHSNIVVLRSAAYFVDCSTLATMLDNRINDILLVARSKHDLSIPLVLLEQSIEFAQLAKKSQTVGKCLQSIIDILLRIAGMNDSGGTRKLEYHSLLKLDHLLTKSDQEIIAQLPLDWLEDFIKLSIDSKLSMAGIVVIIKPYLTSAIMIENEINNHLNNSHTTSSSSKSYLDDSLKTQNINTITNGDPPIQYENKITIVYTDDDKRKILNHIIKLLDQTIFYEYVPLSWLMACHQQAKELNCECEETLSKWITCTLLCSADEDINNIPEETMAHLLEEVGKHRDQVKDPIMLQKLSRLVDSYAENLRGKGILTSENFVKLASYVPKEQRNSYDSLLLALDNILKNDKINLNSSERESLLSQIDFSKITEETINHCKNNELIPQKLITDAALSLCSKLRKELNEAKDRLRLIENDVMKTGRTTITSSSSSIPYVSPNVNHRSRIYELARLPSTKSRTRSTYPLNYSLSSGNYSKYEPDADYLVYSNDIPRYSVYNRHSTTYRY